MNAEDYVNAARRIVFGLCGRRWTYPPVRMTDTCPLPPSGVVFLNGRPVRAIEKIVSGDVEFTPDDYALSGRTRLYFDRRTENYRRAVNSRRCCDGSELPTIDVTYVYGIDVLPAYLQIAIDKLAKEMRAADDDDASCSLPQRVTNVTRQGVSWTLLDPQDFLEDGRTGVYEVDLAIKTANPSKAKARARVFTTTSSAPPTRRTPS